MVTNKSHRKSDEHDDNHSNNANEQQIAEACVKALWRDDTTSQSLGMQIESVAPGKVEMSMTVKENMVNGHRTCHGGFLFTLADSAFAFACNTYDQRSVAQHCNISYLAPAFSGDKLFATATEVSRKGRNGIYDVSINNAKEETIVEFRGYSRTLPGTLLTDNKDHKE